MTRQKNKFIVVRSSKKKVTASVPNPQFKEFVVASVLLFSV